MAQPLGPVAARRRRRGGSGVLTKKATPSKHGCSFKFPENGILKKKTQAASEPSFSFSFRETKD
ncbi:hypothetical protein FRC07_000176 [Ceratobasidium sp. 392]|nr:hypothetical protein FRC07_000176 [Ceratobasidium sp. 392]